MSYNKEAKAVFDRINEFLESNGEMPMSARTAAGRASKQLLASVLGDYYDKGVKAAGDQPVQDLAATEQALAYWLKETEWVQERGHVLGCLPGEHRVDFMNRHIADLQKRYATLRETSQKMSQHEAARTKEIQDLRHKIRELEIDLESAHSMHDDVAAALDYWTSETDWLDRRASELGYLGGEHRVEFISRLLRERIGETPALTDTSTALTGTSTALTDTSTALTDTSTALTDASTELAEWRLVGEVLLRADEDSPEFGLAITMCGKLLQETRNDN